MADKRITHRLRGGLDMLEEIRTAGKDRILHDAHIARSVTPEWFEHGFWHQRQQWTAVSGGRGAGGRIGEGGKWFLRHYLRGGKAALFSRDRYLFMGTRRVRSFGEFRLLAGMHEAGLPVPRPIAGAVSLEGAQAMKVVNSLKTAKLREKSCRVVRRRGRVYVINKKNPRFKARQG